MDSNHWSRHGEILLGEALIPRGTKKFGSVFLRRGVWSHQPLPPQRAKSRSFAERVREDGTSERRGSPGFFIRGVQPTTSWAHRTGSSANGPPELNP